MKINQNQINQEIQNQAQNFFPKVIQGPNDMSKNPITYLSNLNPNFNQDEQTKNNNIFIQKRNLMEDKNKEKLNILELNLHLKQENKKAGNNETNSDINSDIKINLKIIKVVNLIFLNNLFVKKWKMK